MSLHPDYQKALEQAVSALRERLGENLTSLVLYGSAVREAVSRPDDLNLLIVLEESTPEAHAAIARAIKGPVWIEPFILGRALLSRSLLAFAVKFLSIRRHRRVLHGVDPLEELVIPPAVGRFLAEQAVRNLRLRLVRAYVVFGEDRPRYSTAVADAVPGLFTHLGEAIRQSGRVVPESFASRIPLFAETFKADAGVLTDLLALKSSPRTLSADEVTSLHGRLFRLLDAAVRWMEATWPPLS
jgi:hypothetical protein